jgi:hypothetical protein
MGKLSKQAMTQANILPKLQLGQQKLSETTKKTSVVSTGKHYVRLIEEKVINGKEFGTDEVIPKMRYIFEENGEKKSYDARMKDKQTGELHYFVQSMSNVEEGEEIIIEMIKKGMKNVINVQKLGTAAQVEIQDEDIDE